MPGRRQGDTLYADQAIRVQLARGAAELLELPPAAREVEWAVARPVKTRNSRGQPLDLTAEMLAQMVADYDPESIQRSALNFDHAFGGPSLGWITGLRIGEDGLLYATITNLQDEVVNEVDAGRYATFSLEIDPDHPATHRPYLDGLAIMGNAAPGVWGLPVAHLSKSRQEALMPTKSTPTPTPTADPPAAPAATPAAEPSPAPAGDEPTAHLARLRANEDEARATLARVQALEKEARERAERARQQEAELAVERDLGDLTITPGMEAAGLRPALVALRVGSAAGETTIKLSRRGDDGQESEVETSVYDAVLAAFRAMPDVAGATGGRQELARGRDTGAAEPGDDRDAQTRALHARAGIDDQRYQELSRRYGSHVH